ncbi:protein translocase subunit SecF [Streptacidiphilus fuscans]|uniref:Protein-export membrane protein SecF n=1 Tax=Streptacidiphilus fuscans TaxID=2789292 RepID=A0A931B1S2_9ACTN|nr:protein translocase subunit SecF [Streptacidiphilus fuscans]MBF9068653.1 protein translocase subunit SecF [Streptacidiphilus fuscans]
MSRFGNIGHRLYTGEVSFDFVGRRKLWSILSGVILLAAILGLSVRGLNLGIEFKGGDIYTISKPGVTISQAQKAANELTHDSSALVQTTNSSKGQQITVQISSSENVHATAGQQALEKSLDLTPDQISTQYLSASWGSDISTKALEGLVVFMVLVTLYLAFAFEWRLAVGALVALLHDLVITIGVYALVGFEVTSGTVIGFLTILGYSLYDTVVVFDGLKSATKDLTKQNKLTYSDAANASLNSTLVRSINTTVLALLPVAALLFIGGGLLGAGVLNDISLALFVGLTAGAYSSICVATPTVAWLQEKRPEYKELARRVKARKAADAKAKAEGRDVPEDAAADAVTIPAAQTGGPRNQPVNRSRSDRRTGRR